MHGQLSDDSYSIQRHFLQLQGPAVLQVVKIRNVSAPKENEESQTAPRLWKISLTDGFSTASAVCFEPLKNLRSFFTLFC